ncbi:hypothetical protein QN277_028468 [Acacia crassicarpa]|uniref:Uncharacterized protein n=1 Tax=Acacia crassicarpa TaxID=499986 RepID=A0AAE1K3H0_9FABA|nr:hypothetical protein QN277_028468 [Acacia crassicarpa]
MENRVEQLGKVVDEMQRRQAESTKKLIGVDATANTILDQLGEFRAAFNAINNNQIPERTPPIDPQSEGQGRGGAEETGKNEGPKHHKLELSLLSEEDPLGWIFRLERYFIPMP